MLKSNLKIFNNNKQYLTQNNFLQAEDRYVFLQMIQSPFIKLMIESFRVSLSHGLFSSKGIQATLKSKYIYSHCPMLLSK